MIARPVGAARFDASSIDASAASTSLARARSLARIERCVMRCSMMRLVSSGSIAAQACSSQAQVEQDPRVGAQQEVPVQRVLVWVLRERLPARLRGRAEVSGRLGHGRLGPQVVQVSREAEGIPQPGALVQVRPGPQRVAHEGPGLRAEP